MKIVVMCSDFRSVISLGLESHLCVQLELKLLVSGRVCARFHNATLAEANHGHCWSSGH